MEEVDNVHTHDSDEYENEMEICNLANIEVMEEKGDPQTLMRHWKSSRCPELDHNPLVTLHLT